jgi:4-amino-4-deoxy-L-arabinose transferase-like glycosyltransferase
MKHSQNRQLLFGLFVLGWLLSTFIGYIYIHRPFSAGDLVGILAGIWRTLIAIILISLAGGIGSLTSLRKLDIHPFAIAMLTSAFGLGVISTSILLVGATLGINFFLWIILIITGILLRKQIFAWWKYWQPVNDYWQTTSKLGKTILSLTIIILACQYFIALAPPLQFDALTYHLALPKAYIQTGHILYQPDNVFWGMPQLIEMLYTLLMLAGGSEAAPIFGWWIGILTLAGIVGIAEKTFSRDSAWVVVASLICASGFTNSISSGYVEWATMLFGLAMLICLSQWLLKDDLSNLAMAGVFAGMAIGTKYTAGIALLTGFAVILLLRKSYSLKQVVTHLAIFGGMALALTLPWLIKNILATSNPFYPLFFASGAMDSVHLKQYQNKPLFQDWSRLILLPLQITVFGVDGGAGFSASIGPLLLGLSPLALLNWHEKTEEQRLMIKMIGIILLTGFLFWAVGSQFSDKLIQTRLYFAFFPAWALLCAAGYMAISRVKVQGIRFGNITVAFIILAMGFNTFFTITNTLKSDAVLAALNPEKGENYRENNLGPYAVAMQAIKTLPENAHIVMLWETRGFDCIPKCDSDEVIDRWPTDWIIYGSKDAIVKAWKKKGYTHVLINRVGANFIQKYDDYDNSSPEAWSGLEAMRGSLPLVKNIAAGSYEIYSLP